MDQATCFSPPEYLAQVYGMNPQFNNGAIPVLRLVPPFQHQAYVYPPRGNQGGELPYGRFQGGGVQGGHFQGRGPMYAIYRPPRQYPDRTIRQAPAKQDPKRTIRQEQAAQEFNRTVRQATIGSKVKLGSTDYTVVDVLQVPITGLNSMNEGIRVLKNPQGILVVQKKLRMGTSERRGRAEAEKKALHQIAKAGGSRNVNKIYESIWDPGSATSSLVLEYCNRGTLDEFIESYKRDNLKISEIFCWKTLLQLAAALCMCHLGIKDPTNPNDKMKNWNTICHLDIKPPNIFLDYQGPECLEHLPFIFPRVVLGDFGCAVTRDDIMSRKVDHKLQPYGTPYWFPPENKGNVGGMGTMGTFGKYTDIWQMGGVVQTMCRLTIIPDMFYVDEKRPAGRNYSGDMNEALMTCMVRNVNLRPTALDVATAVKGLLESLEF